MEIFMKYLMPQALNVRNNRKNDTIIEDAIKKCRYYGFSSLEIKLLNYLELQYKDMLSLSKR